MPLSTFEDIFNNIKKITGKTYQNEVAAELGITASAISDAKKRNTIPEGWFETILKKYNVPKDKVCESPEEKYKKIAAQHEQTVAEPPPVPPLQKYDHLVWKFQHVFDFLLETHEDDAIAINDFISKMEREFLFNDPDFRLWMYQKREKAAERKKKRAAEGHQDEPVDIISVNEK